MSGVSWRSALALTVLWAALAGSISPGTIFLGLVVSFLVVWTFPFPPITERLVVRPIGLAVLLVRFAIDMVTGSLQVARATLRRAPTTGVVMDMRLNGSNELLLTLTCEMVSLVPGTSVVDLDPDTGVVTLHALDVHTRAQAEHIRHQIRAQEARVLRAFDPEAESLLAARRRQWRERRVDPAEVD